jgi:ABC-type branched-subunit amino acid transport system permease subunit
VVIGGAALTGGRGTVLGTMLGAFVIGFLSDGPRDHRRLVLLADRLHRRGDRARGADELHPIWQKNV